MALSFHDQQHINRLFLQEQSVNRLFGALIDSVSPALKRWNPTGRQNVWLRNAAVENLVDHRLAEFQSEFEKILKSGSLNAWNLSGDKNDKLVSDYIKDLALKQITKQGMFNRNLEALTAFQKRVENGLSLSDRVASTALGAKQQMEHYLRSGIGTGRSASSISQDIRQLLQEPDKRFRRVRNEAGKLVESQPMKDYHPGQGVYRSSYKNAVRIAASETNMAYRMADHERWKQLDFILGFEVKRSRNHESCAVCDALVGKYPKDFVFPGWHPFCICVATPILMNHNDSADYFLRDASAKFRTQNYKGPDYIKDIPAGAKQFMQDNPKLVDKSYFGKQNEKYIDTSSKNELTVSEKIDIEIAKAIENKSLFERNIQIITEKLNILSTPINIKSKERAIFKAENDYFGDVTKVKDLIRNTFIGSKKSDIVKEIDAIFDIQRIKHQKTELGYMGTIVNVRFPNGAFGEIQIATPQMFYGKTKNTEIILGNEIYLKLSGSGIQGGLGHGYYEQWRVLSTANEAELKIKKKIEKTSNAYYIKIRKLKI